MAGIKHAPKSGAALTGTEWEAVTTHTTTETDTAKVLAPDGAGGVEFRAETVPSLSSVLAAGNDVGAHDIVAVGDLGAGSEIVAQLQVGTAGVAVVGGGSVGAHGVQQAGPAGALLYWSPDPAESSIVGFTADSGGLKVYDGTGSSGSASDVFTAQGDGTALWAAASGLTAAQVGARVALGI